MGFPRKRGRSSEVGTRVLVSTWLKMLDDMGSLPGCEGSMEASRQRGKKHR